MSYNYLIKEHKEVLRELHAYLSPSAYKDALYASIGYTHDVEQELNRLKTFHNFFKYFSVIYALAYFGRHAHLVT